MKHLRSSYLTLFVVFVFVTLSRGEICQYGLGGYSSSHDVCLTLQKEALKRVAAAKTICYSANSQVQWSKNNKEPVGAFATMRTGARMAMKGFTLLYSCERAELVVKIDYDDMYGTVKLNVNDADSGDPVFHEERTVSDLSSDVSRMAAHFQSMVSDARAAARAALDEAEAKAKEEAFLANLTKHWRYVKTCATEAHPCPLGPATDVSVRGDFLYEFATTTATLSGGVPIRRDAHCVVKRGTDEETPWAGDCTYELFWNNEATPTCTVKTTEIITSITSKAIAGRSQKIDYTPLRQDPPKCPVPATEYQDFTLRPADEQK